MAMLGDVFLSDERLPHHGSFCPFHCPSLTPQFGEPLTRDFIEHASDMVALQNPSLLAVARTGNRGVSIYDWRADTELISGLGGVMNSVRSIAALGGGCVVFVCHDDRDDKMVDRACESGYPEWCSHFRRYLCIVRTDGSTTDIQLRRRLPSNTEHYSVYSCEDGETCVTYSNVWHSQDRCAGRLEVWRSGEREQVYDVPWAGRSPPAVGNQFIVGTSIDRLIFSTDMGSVLVFE